MLSVYELVLAPSDLLACGLLFTQAVGRCGLQADYTNNHQLKYVIKKAMALPYIPLAFVRNCWQQLLAHPVSVNMLQRFPNLQLFFDYFENTWMSPQGQFPLRMWNVHRRNMEERTTNAVESFHNKYDYYVLFLIQGLSKRDNL